MIRLAMLAALAMSAVACTDILGDFKIEDVSLTDEHRPCTSDEECSAEWYPGATCNLDSGRCHAWLDGGVDGEADAP